MGKAGPPHFETHSASLTRTLASYKCLQVTTTLAVCIRFLLDKGQARKGFHRRDWHRLLAEVAGKADSLFESSSVGLQRFWKRTCIS